MGWVCLGIFLGMLLLFEKLIVLLISIQVADKNEFNSNLSKKLEDKLKDSSKGA